MTRPHKFILIIGVAALSGCNLFNKESGKGTPVARANDTYLYEEDLVGIVPEGLSKEDSLLYIENYIYRWGKQKLVLQKAEFNLTNDALDFEELVQQYRDDLVKFAYQQEFVDQHLDTAILEDEIRAYYSSNPQNFELKENILKADIIIFDSDVPNIEKAKRWFNSTRDSYKEKFDDFALNYAVVYVHNDTNWIAFEDMAKTIPIKTYNQQQFLNKNKNVLIEDSLQVYFLRIKSFKIKDDVSPLPYVRPTVKSILLNKRKLELIKQMEEDIFNNAYEKKEFEVY